MHPCISRLPSKNRSFPSFGFLGRVLPSTFDGLSNKDDLLSHGFPRRCCYIAVCKAERAPFCLKFVGHVTCSSAKTKRKVDFALGKTLARFQATHAYTYHSHQPPLKCTISVTYVFTVFLLVLSAALHE